MSGTADLASWSALPAAVAWRELERTLRDIDDIFGRAIHATTAECLRWDDTAREYDELEVPEEDVAAFSAEEKLEYVARLVATLALRYGYGYAATLECPAALLRTLVEAAHAPPYEPTPDARIPRLLTAKEVGDILRVPQRWVHAEARGGRIPHVRVGRYVRFERDQIEGWMAARRAAQDD